MQLQSNAAPKRIELQKRDQSHFQDLFKIFHYLKRFFKFHLNLSFIKASVFFFYLSCTTFTTQVHTLTHFYLRVLPETFLPTF